MTFYQDHVFWQQRVWKEMGDFRKNLDIRVGVSPQAYVS